MWYDHRQTERVERRDCGFRNTWRRLSLDLYSLPPVVLLWSLAIWSLLLWSTLPGSAQSSSEWPSYVRLCNAEPIPPTPYASVSD